MVLGVAKGLHVRRESGLAIPQKGRSGDSAGGLRSMDSFSGKSDNPSFGRRPCLCGRNSNERQMKRTLFIAALMTAFNFTTMNGQNINEKTLEQRIEAIEDRMAIKNVVDTFSTLADTKEVELQGLLFTEDAKVVNYAEGRPTTTLNGCREIVKAFGDYLATTELTFHQNGQQTVTLDGDRATAFSPPLLPSAAAEGAGSSCRSLSFGLPPLPFRLAEGQLLVSESSPFGR